MEYNKLTEEAKGKTVELFENHLKSVTTPLTTPEMNLGEIT